jgi:hypothetical protein
VSAEVDRCALAIAQLKMPGDEIGVKVGEEHVPDPTAEPVSILDVLIDITLRIDDRSDSAPLISHQIRGMREAPEVVLPKDHPRPPPQQHSTIPRRAGPPPR